MESVIKGFSRVTYPELHTELKDKIKGIGKTDIDIAVMVGVKSLQTIKNIYNQEQIVSDELLNKVFQALEFDAKIVYDADGRSYFIRK